MSKVRGFTNGRKAPKGAERAYDDALKLLLKTKDHAAVIRLADGSYRAIQWIHGLERTRIEKVLGFKFIGGIRILM